MMNKNKHIRINTYVEDGKKKNQTIKQQNN